MDKTELKQKEHLYTRNTVYNTNYNIHDLCIILWFPAMLSLLCTLYIIILTATILLLFMFLFILCGAFTRKLNKYCMEYIII